VNVDLDIWNKLTKLVVGLVVIAVLLLIFMCYRPLIDENEAMRKDILRLDEEIKAQEKTSQENWATPNRPRRFSILTRR